ncbi:MAG: hypothetical protein HKN47_15955 [Pirellulaceae bacterium]|nr:hypothetical protein [Pirellulaceae bacterium]
MDFLASCKSFVANAKQSAGREAVKKGDQNPPRHRSVRDRSKESRAAKVAAGVEPGAGLVVGWLDEMLDDRASRIMGIEVGLSNQFIHLDWAWRRDGRQITLTP